MNSTAISSEVLIKKVIEKVADARTGRLFIEEIYTDPETPAGKNEFLFFIKPEITLGNPEIDLQAILNLIFEKITVFGLSYHNIKILSAEYLKQYDIIAKHYGVINNIARDANANMSETAKEKFASTYGKTVEELPVMGGIEFLEKYTDFNANSIDFLWQNKKCDKLAGGTYSLPVKLDDEVVYLVNGFHPRQLEQYTAPGRSIIVMTLSGNLSWASARSNFIGSTFPSSANSGSIRNELLANKDRLGLAEVSQALNGVHLSAGPVEALVELCRYNSDFSSAAGEKEYTDFSFGKMLDSNFNKPEVEKILTNSNLTIDGKVISVFDLTEEKDSDEALILLKKYI